MARAAFGPLSVYRGCYVNAETWRSATARGSLDKASITPDPSKPWAVPNTIEFRYIVPVHS